jgi:hypothetical protein
MSNDLIAWVVAITLGIAVVVLGLRRNLSEATRNGLPRFEEASEPEAATLGSSGIGRWRKPSLRQRRWMGSFYLLTSLTFAAFAVLSAHDRLFNAILAATFALNAAVCWLQRSPSPSGGPAS